MDYPELCKNSFVAYHTYSLEMEEIILTDYQIEPIYKPVEKKDMKTYFGTLTPKILDFEDKNFKEKYSKLIEPVETYFALFLKFSDEDYFSLFGINGEEVYENLDYAILGLLFPFKLNINFIMRNKNNEKKSHTISITFGGFYGKALAVQEVNSETLEIVPEGGHNILGKKEIKLKN